MTTKLTDTQARLLDSPALRRGGQLFLGDLDRHERRTANRLEAMGLLTLVPGTLYARLTDAGIEALRERSAP